MRYVINRTEKSCSYCKIIMPKGKKIIVNESGAYCGLDCLNSIEAEAFEHTLDNARERYYRGEV